MEFHENVMATQTTKIMQNHENASQIYHLLPIPKHSRSEVRFPLFRRENGASALGNEFFFSKI